jgi:hypothetical protein
VFVCACQLPIKSSSSSSSSNNSTPHSPGAIQVLR